MRANEAMIAYASDEDQLEDKKVFVHNLGVLLSQTREGIVSVELDDDDTGDAIITFKGGHKQTVNIYMDSYIAIVRDVAKAI